MCYFNLARHQQEGLTMERKTEAPEKSPVGVGGTGDF